MVPMLHTYNRRLRNPPIRIYAAFRVLQLPDTYKKEGRFYPWEKLNHFSAGRNARRHFFWQGLLP